MYLIVLNYKQECKTFYSRPANKGVSRYPRYQKIFELAENCEQIYLIFLKL